MVSMYKQDPKFFDRLLKIDVYEMSPKQLKKYSDRAFSIYQPYMEDSEPCVQKMHQMIKRISEMRRDKLKQEISKLEKEKINTQPPPRLKLFFVRVLKLDALKEQLQELELQFKYSEIPC